MGRYVVLSVWICLTTVAAEDLDLLEGDICRETNGTQWTCKRVWECLVTHEPQKEQGSRIQLCNSDGRGLGSVVCCPPPALGVKSKDMCKKYAKEVFRKRPNPFNDDNLSIVDTCFSTEEEPHTAGSNGENAKPKEFPHMALIGYGNASSIDWFCGGSLISERYVLSAAHCTVSGRTGEARWARLGDLNFRSRVDEESGDSQSVQYEIVERINHPDYNPSTVYNDIALYKLNTTVVFNEYIRSVCLHTEYLVPDGVFTATGWGVVEWGGRQSDILQKMKILISSRRDCRHAYNVTTGSRLKDGIKDESMICAGDVLRGRDTCPGDSGGPLQVPHNEAYCMYLQVGITSFGSICAGNIPGVYTRVSHFVPWIESIVWP